MEVNTMAEGEISDVAGEEVAMENMDYVKLIILSNRSRRLREKQDLNFHHLRN
jgi:hypothetical protein